MKKRDRRLITPSRTSLTVGQSSKDRQKSIDDCFCDAVPESTGSSNPEKEKMIDTSSAFYLKGEGTSGNKGESKSGNKDKHSNSVIFQPNPKNDVIVFGPDKKRLNNTNQSRANKWAKKGSAIWLEDKTGKNRKAIQLKNKPLGREKNNH